MDADACRAVGGDGVATGVDDDEPDCADDCEEGGEFKVIPAGPFQEWFARAGHGVAAGCICGGCGAASTFGRGPSHWRQ
jgi:hypothetical protein